MNVVFPNPDSPATCIDNVRLSITAIPRYLLRDVSYHNRESSPPFGDNLVSKSTLVEILTYRKSNRLRTAGLGAVLKQIC